ncbi:MULTISPECIES: hypothetical protein [unclassified Paenibacillus]|uniref:hypothetical protein n=1 Tax=unclassified Paenibacillus TaxID=185978 RepID=UPI0010D98388|nr:MULTISPECIES: hypothetical protein [unclassified Paenibacillus]NIK68393.1 hypothetical protein [Paenibacillus sp. BK720]TCM99320.1 hypothetical protein EV294_102616 [Paenibacillus sp. BK033]
MSKPMRYCFIIFIILVVVGTFSYNHLNNKWEDKYNHLKTLYQQKNDSGYIYIVTHASSAIPLAETLEKISASKEDEDPAKIQNLIYQAQDQAEAINEQLLTIIEFSDGFSKDSVPEISINQTVMTTETQKDMFILAFQADVWIPLHNISYNYWKTKPKLINDETRKTLSALATELRALDQTITAYKDVAAEMAFREQTPYPKSPLLNQLKPHLEKLKSIQNNMYKQK